MGLKTKIFNDALILGIVIFSVGCWGGMTYLILSLFVPITWVEAFILGAVICLMWMPLRQSLKEAVGE